MKSASLPYWFLLSVLLVTVVSVENSTVLTEKSVNFSTPEIIDTSLVCPSSENCIEYWEQILSVQPQYREAYGILALLFFDKADTKTAKQYFDQYIQLGGSPLDYVMLSNL